MTADVRNMTDILFVKNVPITVVQHGQETRYMNRVRLRSPIGECMSVLEHHLFLMLIFYYLRSPVPFIRP